MIQGDVVFGMAVVAVALPVFYAVGRVVARFQNARFARAWVPLVPVVDGTLGFDRSAASSSSLTGTYRGASVRATMAPNVSHSTHVRGNVNRFDVALQDVRGREDWSITYPNHVPLVGSDVYQVKSADPALVARLEQAGVVALADRLERAIGIRYSAQSATLTLREEIQPLWVPRPERFRAELDVLTALAAVNAAVNAAAQ